MGMYTALHLGVDLKSETPKEVLDILEYMCVDNEQLATMPRLPDHPLFQTERWNWMFHCDSYYFDYNTDCSFTHDHITNRHNLSVTCNLKNYDQEIQNFLNWVAPFVVDTYDQCSGYFLYEEEPIPDLIFFKDGKAYLQEVQFVEGSVSVL